MININFAVAFGAGLVSFFAPCVIPLLPAYVGYVAGVSAKDLKEKGYGPYRKKIIISSLFYILGFSLVFVLLGTVSASIGLTLRRYDYLIQRIGGVIIMILGLEFAGVFHLPFLARTRQFSLPGWTNKLGQFRAFVVGFIFATAWTPCIGAVLGSILALAAVTGTASRGAALLFVYSLGISLPFMIVSLTLAQAPKYLGFINKRIGTISKFAGIILAIIGLLLLTDTYKYLNSWLFQVAFSLGYTIK